MFFLILSIVFGTIMSIAMRLSEGKIKSRIGMLASNYFISVIMAGSFMGLGNILPKAEGTGLTIGIGAINGVIYMLALLLYKYSVDRSGVVLSSVFSKMGSLLVPLVISIFAFGEVPTIFQVVGFFLAIYAIILINYKKSNVRTGLGYGMVLLALLICEGFASAMSKIYNEVGNRDLSDNFMFFTFFSAFIICCIILLWKKERPGKSEFLFGIMIGVPNFMATRFILKALESVPAVIVYPLRSIAIILLTTFVGIFVFRERLSRKQFIALVMMMLSLFLLNI